jgi:hypothetical protein
VSVKFIRELSETSVIDKLTQCSPAVGVGPLESSSLAAVLDDELRSVLILHPGISGDPARTYRSAAVEDIKIRQSLAKTGAPIATYGYINGVTCFTIDSRSDVVSILALGGYRLPSDSSIELSKIGCPHLVRERFGLDLPVPRNQ